VGCLDFIVACSSWNHTTNVVPIRLRSDRRQLKHVVDPQRIAAVKLASLDPDPELLIGGCGVAIAAGTEKSIFRMPVARKSRRTGPRRTHVVVHVPAALTILR